jgi:hypothetical protein
MRFGTVDFQLTKSAVIDLIGLGFIGSNMGSAFGYPRVQSFRLALLSYPVHSAK